MTPQMTMRNNASKLLTEEEIATFDSVFKPLVSVLAEEKLFSDISQSLQWMEKVLCYNVPHGKKLRGKLVAMTYKTIVKNPSKDQMYLAYVLGWCVEMLQGCCLVADDIMDNSATRRGQPCWYLVDDMGLMALNDAFLLEQSVYRVLKKYFKNTKHYSQLLDLFHETTYQTVMGQSLDTHTGRHGNICEFDMERYKAIVKYKTGYYTIYLPIALAMTLAGMTTEKEKRLFKGVETVSLLVGELFQVQDDYIDCFGSELETGKEGSDIQNCKCTWLYVTAKRISGGGSHELFSKLENLYGLTDDDSVAGVKQIYVDMGIPREYKIYKENMWNGICLEVARIESTSVREVFQHLACLMFKKTS